MYCEKGNLRDISCKMRDAGSDISFRDCPAKGGTGGHPSSFPGGKARSGRDADHSPPSSAEVKYE
jgi:hypothetical protein